MCLWKGLWLMKRDILAIAAALLLLLSLRPLAYADMTYSAPEDVPIGSELNHLVATVSAGSTVTVSGETLPEGVVMEADENEAHLKDIYLRGVPKKVGQYNCVINIDNDEGSNLIICPVSVVPETPTVTVCAPVHCSLNDPAQVSVEATVVSGSLSYQWYSNTSESIAGSSSIAGATGPVYQVNTAAAGTMYYYCTVTNTVGDQTRSVTSDIISVTVEELTVTSIGVETWPTRTVYTAGDRLDPTGLSIRVSYANGSSRVLTDTGLFGLYPTQLNTAGTQDIEVSYQGLTCIFQVTVEPAEEIIEGIGVLTLPTRRDYTVGDTLDTTGLSIRVYTNNGQRDVREGFICSPMAFDRAGTQTITVSYGDKTCTFTLEIQEEERPASLIVGTLPTKRDYKQGESLDTAGLVLQLISNRGSAMDVREGFVCSPTLLETAGRQMITASYEGFSCTFYVNVSASAASSSPSPSPTVPPVQTALPSARPTITPAPTSHVIEHQAHKTGGGALVAVLLIAALLGLGSLGAYVFLMNRGGVEKVTASVKAFLERLRKRK